MANSQSGNIASQENKKAEEKKKGRKEGKKNRMLGEIEYKDKFTMIPHE